VTNPTTDLPEGSVSSFLRTDRHIFSTHGRSVGL